MKIILQNLNIDLSNLFLINKPGVYLITNLTNGKKYVGSSAIMLRRLKEYSNPLYLKRNLEKGNSKLLRAILKYGTSNFEFKVLEIIEFDQFISKSERRIQLLAREQYFLDEIKPEYNINLKAGSNLGRIYSAEIL